MAEEKVTVKCPKCGGHKRYTPTTTDAKKVAANKTVDCDHCKGTGKVNLDKSK